MELARKQLRQYFDSIEKGFKEVHNGNDLSIRFHLPPARSLLRLWKKNQNQSDDLISFRKTVATISKGDHHPLKGIEIGRGGFVIRGIAPVYDAAKTYLGSVEMLSSYDPLVNYSASNENEYIAVFMNKEFLSIATRLQDASKYPVLDDKFIAVSSTNAAVTQKVLTTDILSRGMGETYMEKKGDYFLTVFPVKDFSGTQIGVMAYVNNAAEMYAKVKSIQSKIAWLCQLSSNHDPRR